MDYQKVIAIDFDGTLFKNEWPDIGAPIWKTIEAAKQEQEAGTALVLWTTREGDKLQEALESCKNVGLNFDAINTNAQVLKDLWGNDPRKIGAAEYWDDHAVNVNVIGKNDRVYVKTRMEKIPKRCSDCSLFTPARDSVLAESSCRAKGDYPAGKDLTKAKPYVGRPSWCPLCTGKIING